MYFGYNEYSSLVVIEEIESSIKGIGFTTKGLESNSFAKSVTSHSTNTSKVITSESNGVTVNNLQGSIR